MVPGAEGSTLDDVRASSSSTASDPTGSWRVRAAAVALGVVAVAGFLSVASPAASVPVGEADHVPDESALAGGSEASEESDAKASGAAKGSGKKDKDDKKNEVPLPPPPAVPAGLPSDVDPLPGYQGQFICSPATKIGAAKLTALIRATYETSSSIWTPRECDQGGRSEHKEGRALDWMINSAIPSQNAQAESFLNWLLATDENGNEFAMARRLGVMYIGWGDEIWESYTQRWTELKGCYNLQSDGYDTYCHRDHIHISLSWDGAAAQTSFWGGDPNPAPFCSSSRTPSSQESDPGQGLDFVPVSPTRIVDTRTGKGLSGQPCRLAARSSGGAGNPLVVSMSKQKAAISASAKAVAVRVTTVKSNSPATLTTVSSGTFDSIDMNVRRDSVSILPVAADGTIAFTTNSGATHVSVDLLGYFVEPSAAGAEGGRLLAHANQVVYDTAQLGQPLAPGEKRTVDVGMASTTDGPPAGALMTVTISGTEKSGALMIRGVGEKSNPAAPRLDYRRKATVTEPIIADLDGEGRILLVNRGSGPIDVTLALQASAVRTPELGALLVPVEPSEVRKKRSRLIDLVPTQRAKGEPITADTLTERARVSASGATAAILRVRATAGKGGDATFYSLAKPSIPSLVVPRKTAITGLIVVPLDSRGTIRRDVVGDLDVTAEVVAYLL